MSKNLKLSYILLFIFSAIVIAWNTLRNFFGGVALSFVGLVGLLFVVLLLILKDKELFKRIKDVFFIACVFCILEIIVFIPFEFSTVSFDYSQKGYEILKGFAIYQNVLIFIGILFFAYISFRFITEHLGKKIKFIEIMLGNEKRTIKAKKVKASKEISNGTLEDKPNNKNNEKESSNNVEETLTEDEVVIIEEETEE